MVSDETAAESAYPLPVTVIFAGPDHCDPKRFDFTFFVTVYCFKCFIPLWFIYARSAGSSELGSSIIPPIHLIPRNA